jgi:transcriptional regulator with XRE-family HTH domain
MVRWVSFIGSAVRTEDLVVRTEPFCRPLLTYVKRPLKFVTVTRRVGDVVAKRVRYYRKRLGWSVRQLAEECASLGAPQLTEASLGNIERGSKGKRKPRDVTVDEVMILGYALGVPPLLLMIPLGENEPLRITSTADLHPHLAWDTTIGAVPLVVTGNFVTKVAESHEARLTVQAFTRLRAAHEAYDSAKSRLRSAEKWATERTQEARQDAVAEALVPYAEAVEDIIKLGLEVPQVNAQTRADLLGTGIISEPDKLIEWVPTPEFTAVWNPPADDGAAN